MKQGRLDLSLWNFEKDGKVELNGEWEFYWKQMLSYEDFHPETLKAVPTPNYLKVPGTWNGKKTIGEENPITGIGFATYRVQIKLPVGTKHFTFKSLTTGTSSAIYVNKNKVAKSGTPGKTDAQTIPDFKPQVFDVYIDTHIIDIIVQTANFDYAKGGMWKPLTIGSETVIRKAHERDVFIDYFLLGGFFIIGLYHFGIFLIRRSDRASLYYAIGAILAGLRVSATGEYIVGYIDLLNWANIIRLELITFFLAIGVLGLFLNAIFPKEVNKKILIVIVLFSSLVSLLTLILPPIYFSQLVNPFQVFTVIALLYFMYTLFSAVKRGRSGSWLFSFGILILSSFIIHDILVSVNIVDGLQLAGLGFFVFMLVQSYILAVNFNAAFQVNSNLRNELTLANDTLEHKVLERTAELSESNQVKDKFFSIISHDLRGPVNSSKNALDFVIEDLDSIDKDEIKTDLQIISKSLRSAHGLLDDLLVWSQSQQGQIELKPAIVSIAELFEKPLSILEDIATKKEIEIHTDFKKEHKVYADLRTIETVLRNIISNAIKFTPSGGNIYISSTSNAKSSIISIKDTGVGIDQKKITTLFQIAKNKSTKGTSGEVGTGLGLILAKEFVDKNNGTLNVESEEGKGTTFFINLPIEA